MGIISILFLYIFIFIVCFILGNFVDSSGNKISVSLVYGFLFNIALLEVLTIPCYLLGASFSILLFTYLFFICVIVIFYVYRHISYIKEFDIKQYFQNIKPSVYFLIFLGIILFQIVYSSYMCHTDADDGYYITISNIAVSSDKLELGNLYVYDGMFPSSGKNATVISWEFFIAILSKVFRIHPAILAHSVLPPILILFSYIAVFDVINELVDDKRRRDFSMLLYSVCILFAGYSRYSLGCFLLLRIWQGKAVLANIAIPVLLHSCIMVYKADYTWKRWIINLLIIISGIGLSVIGTYYMPIAYFTFGLPLVIYVLYSKNYQNALLIIKRVVATFIPIIVFAIYVFLYSMKSIENGSTMNDYPLSYIEVFKETFSNSIFGLLYLVSIIIISFEYILSKKGKKIDSTKDLQESEKFRLILVAIPIVLLCTFLNPLLYDFVSTHITGAVVYWRLYWIFPMYLTVSLAFSLVCKYMKLKWIEYLFVVFELVIIGLSGQFMYKGNGYFTTHENYYKIPQEVLTVVDVLNEYEEDSSNVCMFSQSISYYVRQYDSNIAVVKSRNIWSFVEPIGESDKSLSWLNNAIFEEKKIEDLEVMSVLDELNVNYLYVQGDMIENTHYETIYIPNYGYLYKKAW